MTQTRGVPAPRSIRTWIVAPILVVGTLLLFGGCSSTSGLDLSTAESQMKVGTQAAKLGLWREAKFRFNRAIDIDPDNAQAYNNLAVAYESNGEFEDAREAYLNALRINRGDPYIQKNYSRFTEFYQRYEKAKTTTPDDENAKPAEEQKDEETKP